MVNETEGIKYLLAGLEDIERVVKELKEHLKGVREEVRAELEGRRN